MISIAVCSYTKELQCIGVCNIMIVLRMEKLNAYERVYLYFVFRCQFPILVGTSGYCNKADMHRRSV